MPYRSILALLGVLAVTPVVHANEAHAKDFPTVARVKFVLDCMKTHGGQTYDTLYACSCKLDYLRGKFSYDDFEEAVTFRDLFHMHGEYGNELRDPPRGKVLRKRLAQANREANARCFLSHTQRKTTAASPSQ